MPAPDDLPPFDENAEPPSLEELHKRLSEIVRSGGTVYEGVTLEDRDGRVVEGTRRDSDDG